MAVLILQISFILCTSLINKNFRASKEHSISLIKMAMGSLINKYIVDVVGNEDRIQGVEHLC